MNNSPENEFKPIWNLIFASIKESGELADEALNYWFSDTGLRELTPEKAVFTVASEFRHKTVTLRYADNLKKHLAKVVGYEPEVEIVYDPAGYVRPVLEGEGIIESPLEIANRNIQRKKVESEAETRSDASEDTKDITPTNTVNYNPDYTFDNFVVGGSNSFAYSVAKNVSTNPAVEYNPLFIHGPSGVGKTHLMYAIANKTKQLHPNMNIVFVKGEEFANHLIEALSHKYGGKSFRDKYRTVDMLLIDDVHFIAGREAVQEEFFHTFNSLFESHRQIIVSSDRSPKDMVTLETRIRTRFESGLIADMQFPDYDLRIAIIRNKTETLGIRLDEEIEQYIAERIGSSVRQIEGVIKTILARYYLNGESPSLDSIKNILEDFLKDSNSPRITVSRVTEIAATHFNVTVEDILGKKRDKNIRLARNAAMYIIKKCTTLSLEEIGKSFGGRSHATVVSNCKAATTMAEADPWYSSELSEIEKEARTK